MINDANVVLCEEAFDVRKLIREIKTITEMRAAEDGIQMYIEGDDTELKCPYAVESPLHIRQIFINIITNAIKYNKPGGAVYCSFKEQVLPDKRAGYEEQIRDTGIGMTEEFLKNIFQPFTQENQDARSVYQGTGLGMPIVKNLIDRMRGTLRIESEAGVGTTVYVSLSLPVADKITSTEHEQKRPEKQVNLAGVKVLLAEDNELNREIAKVLLEDEKMIVTEVCNDCQCFHRGPSADQGAGMNEHIAKPLDAKLLMRKIMEYCKRRDA